MMSAGLVQCDPDPADRRAAIAPLTNEGQARLADWGQLHEQRIGQAHDQLPVPDRRAISRALPALGRLTRLLKTSDEHQV
jgi:DNA-binding MarR family transcriptional regulator